MKHCDTNFTRKKDLVLTVLSLLLVLLSLMNGCSSKEHINYDLSTYLGSDTDFEKNVATILPSKEELKNSKVVYYLYYDNGGTDESSEKKMINLTVEYSEECFVKAANDLAESSLLHASESMSRRFYYNGVLYDGFIFNKNGYCAVAYHACSSTNTISFIAFDSWDLQFMDVESALGLFPQFERENQIVSCF